MKRTKWLILCLVLCMMATLGGTIAYLTDSDADVNVMTLGNVQIELRERERDGQGGLQTFTKDKMMLPLVGEVDDDGLYGLPNNVNFLDKIIQVQCNSSNANAYLRVYIGLPSALLNVNGADAVHMLPGENITLPNISTGSWTHIKTEKATIDGIPFDMFCFEYDKLLVPGELTPPVLAGLWLDSALEQADDKANHYALRVDGVKHTLNYDFTNGLQVPVLVQATQADGFTNAVTAFASSGMDDVDFDALLDVNNSVPLSEQLAELLGKIMDAFSDNNGPVELTDSEYDLSNGQFAEKLNAMASEKPDIYVELMPVSENGGSVTITLGDTSLPENVTLIAEQGVQLILIGDE